MLSRRGFLKAGGLTLLGLGLAGGIPAFLAEAAAGEKMNLPYKRKKTLVCIFQRGAMDGLMAVTPFTDTFLQAARPSLFMSAARSQGPKALIDLDGRFGLHPAMAAFEPLFRDGRLGIVHGIGSPNTTRSHFDAQDYMESGTPFSKNTTSGWLNRAVGLLGHDAVVTPFQAVSLTPALPRSLYGDHASIAVSNLRDFALQTRGDAATKEAMALGLEEMYAHSAYDLLKGTGQESFEAIKLLKQSDVRNYKPANGAVYPNSPLGTALKQVAQLIKMDVGLEVAFTESGGWDTHYNQGTDTGIFARTVTDLSNSIVAFWNDLGQYQDDVTVMTMTEFGRTVHQNGTGGTDHGRASCNFILGSDVKGGAVHGSMGALANENLEDGRDLPVTTDFRAVFSEVADRHLGINNDHVLFPGWKGDKIGIMRT